MTRPLKESDIVTPDQGRMIAKEINASYYETSVFNGYGVKQVFENVIRAALIARRQQRFLMNSLKHVQNCLIQEPFLPPKPPSPQLLVPPSQYNQDIWSLFTRKAFTDVVFVKENSATNNSFINVSSTDPFCVINCHKIILITASELFNTFFTLDHNPLQHSNDHHHQHQQGRGRFWNCIEVDNCSLLGQSEQNLTKYASDISIASSLDDVFEQHRPKLFIDDSLLDLRFNSFKNFLNVSAFFPLIHFDKSRLFKHSFLRQKHISFQNSSTKSTSNHHHQNKSIHHRSKFVQEKLMTIFKNVGQTYFDVESGRLRYRNQSIISFGNNISFKILQNYIALLYSFNVSNIDCDLPKIVDEFHQCLQYLDFIDFDPQSEPIETQESQTKFLLRLEQYLETWKIECFTNRLAHFGIEKGYFADVIFKLDDGTCFGHKAVLMARCEVMEAMFKGDFLESSAQIIVFTNVTKESFYNMLIYIYTDILIDNINHKNCLPLIELANRFCLTRLIALIEERVVNELITLAEKQKSDITPIVLRLLEPSQIHNADQLSEFCLYHITTHYNEICHNYNKLLRNLHPENQAYLNRNRWPPIWYLKEYDYFERCVREREWQSNPKCLKRYRSRNRKCLFCFPSPMIQSKRTDKLKKSSSSSASYSGLTSKIIRIL
ncbi:Rho GTPase-like protein 1 [Sarcoptes scabiei]|uniref:Rho GTPase-like protein 1 n=1 Tax=Sarcoptes scabiei TaxID=52283 RepID=A0A131ZV44_SARSC|nr:Rho GTPase-like protein 1 [Sarcoptes scabiei]